MTPDMIKKKPPLGAGPLKLDLNEHSEGAPAWAVSALAQIPKELIWRYTQRESLEKALADHFGLNPERVLATNGGDEAIANLFAGWDPETPVLLPLPTFGFYEEQAALWGLRLICLAPAADLRLDLSALLKEAENYSRALLVLVRPNNPTGESIPRQKLVEVLEHCRVRENTLLLDEAYAEFAQDHALDLLDRYENLVILRTFSKAQGLAGLRVGCLLGPAAILQKIRARTLPYNLSSISLFMAERALEEDARRETAEYLSSVKSSRDRLWERLRTWNVLAPRSQANFLLLQLGQMRARFVSRVLESRDIWVRHFQRSYLAGCIRISIPSRVERLLSALAEACRPDLICLDVDGCLIDTRSSFDRVVKETVAAFTGERIASEAILALRAESGFNDDIDLARELIRRSGHEVSHAEVAEDFRVRYLGGPNRPGLHENERPLIDPKFFTWLRKEFQVALVTGRDRREAGLGLRLLGLHPDFPCITVDDVARGKPDPEGIRIAAEKVGARRVWMLGDNVDDVLAARNAGAVPIGIGLANRKALRKAGAAIVLENINQLADLLGAPGSPSCNRQ